MGTLDHDGLLALARRALAAAERADRTRLVEDLHGLVHALDHHLDREQASLGHLAPGEARLLRRGQARVVEAARTLLDAAEGGCVGGGHRCTARVEELVLLLALQADDEGSALHRPLWRAAIGGCTR